VEYLSKTRKDISDQERDRILEEVYVLAETEWIRKQPNVKKAMAERGLQVHAFVYDKMQNRCVRLVESEIVNGMKWKQSFHAVWFNELDKLGGLVRNSEPKSSLYRPTKGKFRMKSDTCTDLE
jgi:hypothetical protein